MSGQYAIKGFLYQALVALLDSFKNEWVTVSVEPNMESEKVDILWEYSDAKTKVVQVKSSKNTFKFRDVEKWALELKEQNSDANYYELVLVGRVPDKIQKILDNKLNEVHIVNKNLSIEDFEKLIINEIKNFFEKKGKIVKNTICEFFVKCLNSDILKDSVSGVKATHREFEEKLYTSLASIYDGVLQNPYAILLSEESSQEHSDVKNAIIHNFLKLIGWDKFNCNESATRYDSKLDREVTYTLDYWADKNSPLFDNKKDLIYVNSSLEAEDSKKYFKAPDEKLYGANLVRKQLLESKRILKVDSCAQYYIHLALALPSEKTILKNDNILKFSPRLIEDDIVYSIVAKDQLNFIVSSIITAKKYRESDNLCVKFLYPVTESNLQFDKIGKRDIYFPPQYINSSIIPIIKEDKDKISILLFCSDSYNKNTIKKIIWLLLRLTNGLANEYVIYIPGFEQAFQNEFNEIVRSFDNNQLLNQINIKNLALCDALDLRKIPISDDIVHLNQDCDAAKQSKQLKINAHLIDYLPYGDSIKPFLASEAVDSSNLKNFMKSKGVYFKTASKSKIVQYMSCLLYSAQDIELLVNFVNIHDKPLTNRNIEYPIVEQKNIEIVKLLDNIQIDKEELTGSLNAEILGVKVENTNSTELNEYEISLDIEQNNPNKQALVSTSYSTCKVLISLSDNSEKLSFRKSANSKLAHRVASCLVKQIKNKLVKSQFIRNKSIEIKFSNFDNQSRMNFLLSFTNLENSTLFSEFDVNTLKYMFDDTAEIPPNYEDRKGKACIIDCKGKNLATIKELQDESLKSIILGEEITITYKFNVRKIGGNYKVVINFSDALSNVPIYDGVLSYKGVINFSKRKQITNTNLIENQIQNEFITLLESKLKKFNKN